MTHRLAYESDGEADREPQVPELIAEEKELELEEERGAMYGDVKKFSASPHT